MPDNNIRNITISATSDTKKAEDSLDRLIFRLKTIKGIVNSGLNFHSKGIENITSALKGLKDVKISKTMSSTLSALSDALEKFSYTAVHADAGNTVKTFADGLSALKNIKISGKLISDLPRLGTALSYFARLFTDDDAKRLGEIAAAVQAEAAVDLKGISSIGGVLQAIKTSGGAQMTGVSQTVQQSMDIAGQAQAASSSVSGLVGSLYSLRTAATTAAVETAKIFVPLLTPITAVGSAIGHLTTAIGTKLAPVMQAIGSKVSVVKNAFASLATTISSNVTHAFAAVANTTRMWATIITSCHPALLNFVNWLKQVGTAGVAVANVLLRVTGTVLSLSKAILSTTVTAIKKLGSVALKVAAPMSKLTASIAVAPFKKLGLRIADLTKRFTGFLAAIKRIAVYRAIRTALKEISQGFREGVENLYQYSLLINGEFAQSMDTIATASLYAKNSLGAMAAPIINALAPAIDFLVDKFVNALNTINELIASLTGAQTWTRALKYPKAYADALDGANGKAKELRATLLGFDEINRLDDNKKGSRGSAAYEMDYSKMFTEEVVTSKAKGIISMLKEAFLSGDFYDIGSMLGEKLREGLSNIPWDSIKDRINENAMSAATFINGIVDTEGLPDEIGHTIAEAFNTMVSKINTFFGNVKWDKVGEFVGDTLSKAVEDIDKQELASAIKNILGAALDVAWGMIQADPLVGTIALVAIGLRFGKLLGTNMATGVSNSGLSTTIQGLIPKVAAIAITAVVSFKIGNYLYNNVGWIQDLADNLVEGWNAFWETDAYKAVAHFWAQANGLADMYVQKAKIWEGEQAWLLQQGLDSHEAYNVLMAQDRLSAISFRNNIRDALGLTHNGMLDILETIKETSKLTDEEYEALQKLTIKRWEVSFEAKFGKTPQEMAQEWMDNLKTKLQPVADALKKAGGDWGKALKDGLLDIFSGDTIKNQIKKCLPTTLSMSVTVTGSTSNTANYVKGFAGGGNPAAGSLFIAGERGAELVSSTGHGTNVANQNQIAASVAEGVEYANEEQNALLREQNELLRDLLRKDFTAVAQITTGQIRNALDRDNKRAGTTLVAVN